MSSAAVPISDSSTPSTATYITDSRRLLLIRALWFAIAAFEFTVVGVTLLLIWDPNSIPTRSEPMMDAVGMSVRQYTIMNMITGLIGVAVYFIPSCILMWRSRNERTALFFAFLFLPFMSANFSSEVDSSQMLPLKVAGILFVTAVYGWVYLFPTGRFFPIWMKYLYALSILTNVLAIVWAINLPIGAFTFLAGFIAMFYRYRRSERIQRQQMKWLLFIFFMVAIANLVFVIVGLIPTSSVIHGYFLLLNLIVFSILVSAWPFAILFAILRYGLWNIDLVINRSLVYGVVTLMLLGLFVGSVFAIQSVLGAERTLVSFLVSAIGPVLLFNPARKRVQHLIDRYIYRLNFDLNELAAAQKPLAILNPGILSGKTLNGYEVRDVLGQGGMGEVYEGFGNGQRVAIKTMLPKIAADANMRSRFQREAQAGMQMNHANIARVYEQGEIDGTPYLIMDYVEGQDLSHIIKSRGKLDEETTVRLLQDVCEALDTAHQQGFIHRDLKPSNIMVKPNGEAVLMDFGITKKTDASTSLTGTGAIGTIDYMAPEQIMSAKEVDKRADIYALGVMLYEMVTGEKPFKGSAAQILFAHLQQPAPDARDFDEDIPRPIAKTIQQAMSKTPDERFASAGALLAAIKG